MDGLTDGWIDERMDGLMDRVMDGLSDGWINGQTDSHMNRSMDRLIKRLTDEWTD